MNENLENDSGTIMNIINSIMTYPTLVTPRSSAPTIQIPNYIARYYDTNLIENILLQRESEDLIRRTLDARPNHKNVLSECGEKELTKIKFNPEVHKQSSCPIMQMDFEPNEEITKLPCDHYFNTEAIERWLKKEKAECPICRCCLKHKEVRVDHTEGDHLTNSRIRLYNSLSRISPHPFGPRFEMTYIHEDDNDLQEAIMASTRESYSRSF